MYLPLFVNNLFHLGNSESFLIDSGGHFIEYLIEKRTNSVNYLRKCMSIFSRDESKSDFSIFRRVETYFRVKSYCTGLSYYTVGFISGMYNPPVKTQEYPLSLTNLLE